MRTLNEIHMTVNDEKKHRISDRLAKAGSTVCRLVVAEFI